MTKNNKSLEKKWLRSLHTQLSGEGLLDLHTYFYFKNMEVCPICNEWLVMRVIPKEITT